MIGSSTWYQPGTDWSVTAKASRWPRMFEPEMRLTTGPPVGFAQTGTDEAAPATSEVAGASVGAAGRRGRCCGCDGLREQEIEQRLEPVLVGGAGGGGLGGTGHGRRRHRPPVRRREADCSYDRAGDEQEAHADDEGEPKIHRHAPPGPTTPWPPGPVDLLTSLTPWTSLRDAPSGRREGALPGGRQPVDSAFRHVRLPLRSNLNYQPCVSAVLPTRRLAHSPSEMSA